MLQQIIDKQMIRTQAVVGFYPANSRGDDLVVYPDDGGKDNKLILPFLRNQRKKEAGEANLCLSDFFMPEEKGRTDYVGAFFATAGLGVDEWARQFEKVNDDYSAVMLKILSQRLAEALTEMLHEKVRKEWWGYAPDESFSPGELLKER
jgi:5-methyltetrahydrofolate--homocysteine methyltransferase